MYMASPLPLQLLQNVKTNRLQTSSLHSTFYYTTVIVTVRTKLANNRYVTHVSHIDIDLKESQPSHRMWAAPRATASYCGSLRRKHASFLSTANQS